MFACGSPTLCWAEDMPARSLPGTENRCFDKKYVKCSRDMQKFSWKLRNPVDPSCQQEDKRHPVVVPDAGGNHYVTLWSDLFMFLLFLLLQLLSTETASL